ncbi:Clp protease ClpE, partial [Salmonella enterica subsp. enterica]|nr:Clp protease ClpE [Salmonella enterica subsp. enterica serovar Manchester]
MPGDEVQVKGNVVKVDSLNDWGELQTWTINRKKPAAGQAKDAEQADAEDAAGKAQ